MAKRRSIEKPALLIIDMVKDTFDEAHRSSLTPLGQKIIAPINRLISDFRQRDWPVVFSTDAFQPNDFLFKGKMLPHSLAGTQGAEVIDELDRRPEDLWLPKPKFSAFFGTDLGSRLKDLGVTLCAVSGLTTHFCVLSTVMDALSYDFKAVFLEDCTAAAPLETHQRTIDNYRRNSLYPLLRVLNSRRFIEMLS